MQEKFPDVATIFVISSIIILILIMLIIASLFTNQKRKLRHHHQLESLQHKFDEEILRTQLEIQTQTYETVSRELHDNVSNTISVALLNLNLIPDKLHTDGYARIEEAKKLLLEAKHSVKDFSWSINPQNINELSLDNSLEQLVEKFGKLKLYTISCTVTGEKFKIEGGHQIIIYRIVQETLSNITKHATAKTVALKLHFAAPLLQVMITDDGAGFNVPELQSDSVSGQRSGLKNMKARAAMIGAALIIESVINKGTTVGLTYINGAGNDGYVKM